MNIRWLFGNYADPEFKLTRQQQREVTMIAHRQHLQRRTLTIWTFAMLLGGFALVGFGWEPLAALMTEVGIVFPRWTSMLAIIVIISVVSAWLYRYIYVRPVRMAMRDLGYDVCIGCGYRLHGLPDTIHRCPECGHPRALMPSAPGEQTGSASSDQIA